MVPEQKTPSVSSKKPHLAFELQKVVILKHIQAGNKPVSKVFKINKKRIVVGSLVSADVRIAGDGVAPIHAVLELNPDSATGEYSGTVFDLASDTGVFVNDKKVVTQKLKNSDEIVIGRHRLKYSLEDLKKSRNQEDRTRETEGRTLFMNPKEDLASLLLEDEREVEEIFDYRPTSKKALEVVMSWCGAILSVEHFIKEKNNHGRKYVEKRLSYSTDSFYWAVCDCDSCGEMTLSSI
jgi:pSer/pThr/pTyr-binding forkhead associated (FHA) protein